MARRAPPAPALPDDALGWRHRSETSMSLLFDVFVLGQRVSSLVSEAMRDVPLRPDEYAAYSVVFEKGPITMTELSVHLAMPLTTIADYVRAMVERGHLRRSAHPKDQRATLLSLTAAGLRTHRRAAQSFERARRALVSELGQQEEARARMVLQQLAGAAERALGSGAVQHRAG